MNIFTVMLICVGALVIFTRIQTKRLEKIYPPVGEFVDIGGYHLHAVHVPKAPENDLLPIVFIHGASGNLRDPMSVFHHALVGRAEMLFIDRPGHGYSERGGQENDYPDGQASAVAALMAKKGIDRAIIVGHSFGGAIAASFALAYPQKTAGLVFLAPATHPWPGGVTWYYSLASIPVVGRLFSSLLSMPIGLGRVDAVTRCVFAPNDRPDDYIKNTAPHLVLRPHTFRHNAADVANLLDYVKRVAPEYSAITAPTVIITGDDDGVVRPDLHSLGLHEAIVGSKLYWIDNLGHKPDYIASDLAIAAIEDMSGLPRDLEAHAARVAERISGNQRMCPSQ